MPIPKDFGTGFGIGIGEPYSVELCETTLLNAVV